MNNIKTIDKLHRLAFNIAIGDDVEESKKDFKMELAQAKNDGLDLNGVITQLNCEGGYEALFDGDLTKNWKELYRGNWNGHYYVGNIKADYIVSMNIYTLLAVDNNVDVINIIKEVYSGFDLILDNSIVLNLEDVLNEMGYLKIEMLDNRYLLTEEEKDKFSDWIKTYEDTDDCSVLTDEYKISTKDILNGNTVQFKIKASEYEAYDEWNDVDYLEKEIVK